MHAATATPGVIRVFEVSWKSDVKERLAGKLRICDWNPQFSRLPLWLGAEFERATRPGPLNRRTYV